MSGIERQSSGLIKADYWPDRILLERVGMSIYADTASITMKPDSFRACMDLAKTAGKEEIEVKLAEADNSFHIINELYKSSEATRVAQQEALEAILKAHQNTNRDVIEALALAQETLAHDVPHDCWATGPKTDNDVEDLIACPGCRAIHKIEVTLTKVQS